MKRFLPSAAALALLGGFYLLSYRFSGVYLDPSDQNSATLRVLGIPLPATPAVLSTYQKLYWPLIVRSANQKPPRKVVGAISTIDWEKRYLTITTAPDQGIRCTFSAAYDETLRGLKDGDKVTASLGRQPDPRCVTCWTFKLLTITADQ